jgi:hypothetical protein
MNRLLLLTLVAAAGAGAGLLGRTAYAADGYYDQACLSRASRDYWNCMSYASMPNVVWPTASDCMAAYNEQAVNQCWVWRIRDSVW